MPQKTAARCVLVVEDPLIQRFVGGLLKREGRQVVESELEGALNTLRHDSGTVSLLITNAPAHFLEFAETVRIIYMAAFPDPELAGRFRSCRTLRKPFRPSELVATAAELAPLENF